MAPRQRSSIRIVFLPLAAVWLMNSMAWAENIGRLALANWLTAADNPLSARVIVNRVWRWHFGRGLIGTPDNFGMMGDVPTHPELLDWLALDFIQSGWSLKRMHRRPCI